MFAPNDLAFMQLSHLEDLKTNLTLLQNFLKYHAVKGIYMKKDLDANDMELPSVSGENIRVNLYRSTKVSDNQCHKMYRINSKHVPLDIFW